MAINTSLQQSTISGGGTITTGSFPRLLQDGVYAVFGRVYNERETQWDKILERKSSSKNFEIGVQAEGFGLMSIKPQGDDITFDSRRQGFTPKFIHVTYAKGFIATMEALQDERYGEIKASTAALARSARQTEETTGANILNRGHDATSTMVDGDGVELFSTVHPNGPSGGTYSNTLAVAASLTESSLEDLTTQIRESTDARGLITKIMPTRLIVPPALQWEAHRILGSVLQNDTANNATNALRDTDMYQGGNGYVVNDYLTDPDAWFVKTDAPDGLCRFDRMAIAFGEDNAFTSGNGRFKAVGRWSDGWMDARGCFSSNV